MRGLVTNSNGQGGEWCRIERTTAYRGLAYLTETTKPVAVTEVTSYGDRLHWVADGNEAATQINAYLATASDSSDYRDQTC